MARNGSRYPETYGSPTDAIPDIKGPLNIDAVGSGYADLMAPANDMQEIPDGPCPDPMDFVDIIEPTGSPRGRLRRY
jgi:hypothetical protein